MTAQMALPIDEDINFCWCCDRPGRPGRLDRYGWLCDNCRDWMNAPRVGCITLCGCGRAITLAANGKWVHWVGDEYDRHSAHPKPFFTDREVTP